MPFQRPALCSLLVPSPGTGTTGWSWHHGDCVCIPAQLGLGKAAPTGFLQCPAKPSCAWGVTLVSPAVQVLDVSGASVLASAIPDCHVYILENCGHSVVVERPRKTANLILEFLALLHSLDSNKKQA